MLSDKARRSIKDFLVIAFVFLFISGAYLGFAVAERYRAFTALHIAQSQEIIKILQAQSAKVSAAPPAEAP